MERGEKEGNRMEERREGIWREEKGEMERVERGSGERRNGETR